MHEELNNANCLISNSRNAKMMVQLSVTNASKKGRAYQLPYPKMPHALLGYRYYDKRIDFIAFASLLLAPYTATTYFFTS